MDKSSSRRKMTMLFNKKPDEEFGTDFAPKKPSTMTYGMEQTQPPARKTSSTPTRSLIDSWLNITGNLQSEGEVQVDGHINGDIRCAHLTVGKDATIVGN